MKTGSRFGAHRPSSGRAFGRRPPRQNTHRRPAAARRQAWLGRLMAGVWVVCAAAAVAFASIVFVFIHDIFTQSEHFTARQILVESGPRLNRKEILARAGVQDGVNVLSVNLSAARKRLLAHPWIAEAEIQREIPSTLRIRIREHVPSAVIDLGKKFLLNEQGELFKEFEPTDPAGLPVVTGLKAADLRAVDRTQAASGLPFTLLAPSAPPPAASSRPMEAVMQVLALGREKGSVLPAGEIRAIRVDRELGVTVIAPDNGKAIRLGYTDYPAKYRLLADLLTFIKSQPGVSDFDRIDLTDMNRVIVNPVRAEMPAKAGPRGG